MIFHPTECNHLHAAKRHHLTKDLVKFGLPCLIPKGKLGEHARHAVMEMDRGLWSAMNTSCPHEHI